MAVQAVSSPFHVDDMVRYIVRTADGQGCGHQHRVVASAWHCLHSLAEKDTKARRMPTRRYVVIHDRHGEQRLPLQG